MFRNRSILGHGLFLVAALALTSCKGGNDSQEPDEPLQTASSKARVKAKSGTRIANDLSQALGLARGELCSELSTDDCFEVHKILLGGVDPYRLRIDEPLPVAPVAAPLAVERIALSACGERAARDFASPNDALLYQEIAQQAPTPELLSQVTNRLYEQLLARPATETETQAMTAFYDELGERPERAKTWAQLSCFAVATTNEFLFY